MLLDDRIFLGVGTQPEYLLLKYGNRHGLITGATGTGKTVTLQGIAEGFSRAGVPVFLADVKGDLAGLSQTGEQKDVFVARARQIGFDDWHQADNASVTLLNQLATQAERWPVLWLATLTPREGVTPPAFPGEQRELGPLSAEETAQRRNTREQRLQQAARAHPGVQAALAALGGSLQEVRVRDEISGPVEEPEAFDES